jgi:hypothetical protein
MSASLAGAMKQRVETLGLSLAAYRDAMPNLAKLPCVTVDESIATTDEQHGDTQDPSGHFGVRDVCTVHLWERWRTDDGSPAEDYELANGLHRGLKTTANLAYGTPSKRIYGVTAVSRARIVEEDANVVHTAFTITVRRDM